MRNRAGHRTPLVVVLLAVAVAAVPAALGAQATADASPFRRLDLPAANSYRTGSGRPGPDYWQQRVDYRIRATLDPAANTLSGREEIHYQNNSPDTLAYVWLFLDQNICAPASITNTLHQPPLVFQETSFDFSCQGFPGGVSLTELRVDGEAATHHVYGTTMRVTLPHPLPPGLAADLEVAWSFPVPPYGAGRMGHDGDLYEIAQWYPRLAVYDDVRGWNTEPYIGAGEFYLEYGSFDVELTVPASYIVAATGLLQNEGDVLTRDQRRRLDRARQSNDPVAVITKEEAGTPASRPKQGGTLAWRFHADNVRDFAFAAGPRLRWDAVNWDGILIQTLYRPEAEPWQEAIRMARSSIQYFSQAWYRYPYPQATTVEGPIEGMEYPMLTFVPVGADRHDLQWTLSHEFGHEWFPMVVGSNERDYPWMDEGFNTFIDIGEAEHYFAPGAYADTIGVHALHLYPDHATDREQPMGLRPVESHDLFWTAYQKPALMLQLLRFQVMGQERFDHAFRTYIRAWAFRHPTPADFFRVMEDAGGMDLDWFWREWIYETARLDQAVDAVTARAAGGTDIRLVNRADMVMPAELRITFQGGDTTTVKLPVEMWNLGPSFTYEVDDARPVTEVVVDPGMVYPDIDRSNNVWRSGSP